MTRALSSPPELPASPTATALLDAAERLFAEKGLAAVSIRRIVLASGQGNLSAAHYHFGSRDALVRAVIERRLREIDAIRNRRLDALEAAGRAGDVGAIVAAAVGTLAEAVQRTDWGVDYVRVLSQAMFDPSMRLWDTIDPRARAGFERAAALARRALPDLPAASFDARVEFVHHETVYALARWVGAHGRVTDANRDAYRRLVRELVAFMSGGLAASPRGPRATPSHRSGARIAR